MGLQALPSKVSLDKITLANWNAIKGNFDQLIARGTSLPAGPLDGDLYKYIADDTNGIEWSLVYDASQARWRKVGGAPLYGTVATNQSTTSTTFADLATALSVTLPLSGTFLITGLCSASGSTSGSTAKLGVKVGAAAAVAICYGRTAGGTGADEVGLAGTQAFSGNSTDVVKLQHAISAGTGFFQFRTLIVDPVFVF